MRPRFYLLSLFVALAAVGGAQELSREYVYVGNRLLTVDVPAATGDPDLRIDSLVAIPGGPAGGTIRVDYEFGNSGTATSAATSVAFYFSTDSTITTGDTASSTTVTLGSGFTGANGFVNVQVPSGLSPGTYYLGAFIDQPPVVAEFDETNNFKTVAAGGAPGAITVTAGSGVAPQVISLAPTSGSGGKQEFTGVFEDADGYDTLEDMYLYVGDSPSTGCYVRYERSVDQFYILGFDNVTWVEIPPGSYAQNARCILDSSSDVSIDEPNDRISVTWAIEFRSPFSSGTAKNVSLEVFDAVGYSDSSTEGTWTVPVPNLSFSCTGICPGSGWTGFVDVEAPLAINVLNDGPEVTDLQVQFHRTSTGAGSPPNPLTSATKVGTCYVTIPAGGSVESSAECLDSVTLGSTGTFKIWAVMIDQSNVNEDNALAVQNITISNPTGSGNPDLGLTPTSVYPRTLPVGGYGFMNFMVLNHEFVSYPVSHSSTVGVYLSTDPLVTTADHLLATCSVGSFSTWFSEACSYLFFDPNETGLTNDSDYYVKAIADIYNNVSESNESNQASTSGHVLHYGGDFEGTMIQPTITSLPAEASLDETISYSLKARNVAPSNVAALGPFYGDIYISETGYLDVGWKQLLGSCTSWSENTQVEFFDGQPWETTCSGTVDIPSSVQGSDHFIVVDFRFNNQAADSLLPGGHTTRRAIDLVLPPAVESVTPASGTGQSQIFTLTYSDGDGAEDIWHVLWVLNGSLAYNGACAILYFPDVDALHLIDDDGASWGTPITPGSGSLSNSTCSIDGTGVAVSSSGSQLEIVLPVSFDYYLGSNQTQWMMAVDDDSQNTGWVEAGTWTVPGVESTAPQAVSVSPSSGEGLSQEFAVTLSDANGTVDLANARVLINTSVSTTNACYVEYMKPSNSIRLLNDSATAWTSTAVLGASTVLENSQCRVNAAGSSVSTAGTELELALDMDFLPAFQGAKNVYALAFDMSGYQSGWQTLGTWDVATVYAYRRLITIPSSQVPHSNTLTDFPVLVSGTWADLKTVANGGDVQHVSGYDIRFETTTGTKLDHEIEKWNPSTGQLVAWVRIPSLDGSADTTLYMYYGNSAVTTPEANPSGVWASGYSGVWHFNQAPTGTAPQVKDSTSNANHGSAHGSMTSGDLVAGKVGDAIDFDGTNDRLQVGYDTSFQFGSNRSFSAWVNIDAWGTSTKLYIMELLTNEAGTCVTALWRIGSKGQSTYKQRIGHSVKNPTSIDVESSGNLSLSTWTKIDVTSDGSDARFYINGSLNSTVAHTTSPSTCTNDYYIGANTTSGQNYRSFDGRIDEMRVVKGVTRSGDWIATEYANQNAPGTFVTVGTEESGN